MDRWETMGGTGGRATRGRKTHGEITAARSCRFEKLDDAIKAVLAGKKIHFVGATGDLNFSANGRVNALAYDIWQHQADGTAKVINTIVYTPQK